MAVKAVAAKPKVRPKPAPANVASDLTGDPWMVPPINTEERLRCIEALGQADP